MILILSLSVFGTLDVEPNKLSIQTHTAPESPIFIPGLWKGNALADSFRSASNADSGGYADWGARGDGWKLDCDGIPMRIQKAETGPWYFDLNTSTQRFQKIGCYHKGQVWLRGYIQFTHIAGNYGRHWKPHCHSLFTAFSLTFHRRFAALSRLLFTGFSREFHVYPKRVVIHSKLTSYTKAIG